VRLREIHKGVLSILGGENDVRLGRLVAFLNREAEDFLRRSRRAHDDVLDQRKFKLIVRAIDESADLKIALILFGFEFLKPRIVSIY